MKTTNLMALVLMTLVFASACKKKDDINSEPITLKCDAFKSNNPDKITKLEDRGTGIDYIIDCKSVVEIDLVIDPGVTIAFSTGAGLEIATMGSINATGTGSKMIEFTGVNKVKGAWLGVLSYSDDVKNRLQFCKIDYAGGGSFNSNGDLGNLILWADTYMRIENTTISNGAAYGINAVYQNYNVEINNCTITGCDMPFYGDANIAHKISGGTFTGNTTDVIRLRSDAGNRKISTNQTWTNLGVPYRISTHKLIIRMATLTIQPGVTVEFENGSGIKIGDEDSSTLIAVGTSSNPITFTGVTKAAGAWSNISFDFTKSPLNEISHAIIEYAGSAGSYGAIYMWAKPVVKVTNVEFKNLGACALYAAPSGSNPNDNLVENNNTTTNVTGGYLCGQ
jgi:hypothetical protein